MLLKKCAKKGDVFLGKKGEENQNLATNMISVDGKGTVFQ